MHTFIMSIQGILVSEQIISYFATEGKEKPLGVTSGAIEHRARLGAKRNVKYPDKHSLPLVWIKQLLTE